MNRLELFFTALVLGVGAPLFPSPVCAPARIHTYYLRQLEFGRTLFTALRAYLTFPRAWSVLYACFPLPPSLGLSCA